MALRSFAFNTALRWRRQELFFRGSKIFGPGEAHKTGYQRQSPGGGLTAKHSEADDFMIIM